MQAPAYVVEIGGGGWEWMCEDCYEGMDDALGADLAAEQREGCHRARLSQEPESGATCMCCDATYQRLTSRPGGYWVHDAAVAS